MKRKNRDTPGRRIAQAIIAQYKPKSVAEMHFPEVVVQRCIVHLIRNSLKYVSTRDYKNFTAHLKKIYGASSLKACRVEKIFRQRNFNMKERIGQVHEEPLSKSWYGKYCTK